MVFAWSVLSLPSKATCLLGAGFCRLMSQEKRIGPNTFRSVSFAFGKNRSSCEVCSSKQPSHAKTCQAASFWSLKQSLPAPPNRWFLEAPYQLTNHYFKNLLEGEDTFVAPKKPIICIKTIRHILFHLSKSLEMRPGTRNSSFSSSRTVRICGAARSWLCARKVEGKDQELV